MLGKTYFELDPKIHHGRNVISSRIIKSLTGRIVK